VFGQESPMTILQARAHRLHQNANFTALVLREGTIPPNPKIAKRTVENKIIKSMKFMLIMILL
jgi:hypothetical protein